MQRRQFIASAGATFATASLAGCSGILGGGGGSPSGPAGAVHDYANAINNDDPDALMDAIHPDSPEAGQSVTSQELSMVNMKVKSTNVTEESEEQATVEAKLKLTVSMGGQSQSETQTVTFDVRKHEGEWKVYSSGM